ncbi:hypothetical protein EXU85_23405 [Spirosoma sp. KCTC 42546]|uniref:hypothetical protein n=1 Tax=Spirosoma sp. KCTC 42546 TaxID=2520506 RepID=UPI001158BF14|nr:hypothetical protein [Spirosoma sp. KCTC 42546]QDK81394.1 hypothetical protein EXU85_23405 [Spirosoma sp. KCTC 42546]
MKNSPLLTLVTLSIFIQCSPDKSVKPVIDNEQASIQLMKELVPQLTGTWAMKQLQIKYQNSPQQIGLKIKKDTTLINFATLTLARASIQNNPIRDRYEGIIQYSTKTYPIRFDLLAGSLNRKGPKAYFLLDYNFPIGYSGTTEREAYFLEQIGILLETFALETASGSMTWHGLNRGVDQIDLIKK